MKTPLSSLETRLLLACASALLIACLGPAVAQYDHYHAFADQRVWWGIPHAMDVLSNIPFAVGGIWGLVQLWRHRLARSAQRYLSALFFLGLVVTALCSSVYHWQPGDGGLVFDRLGIVLAFAGLLGLALADRVSDRAGLAMMAVVLVCGPYAVGVWVFSGNLLPWAVLQGGGMLLLLCLAWCPPAAETWGIRLGTVIVVYSLAKLLELGDHSVFAWTGGWVSGHSLKHALAALAAWPVLVAMRPQKPVHNGPRSRRAALPALAWRITLFAIFSIAACANRMCATALFGIRK
ncbi:hypothetical protein [Rhodoferax sp.]|uniref:hypothetical protein n=1 Tax=Rhodoferax sp. TaxID=50421 RepID=UPI00374CCA8D